MGRKSQKQRKPEPRKMFKFWLRLDRAEDLKLIEYIEYLVSKRQFVTEIRTALRLLWSLRQGNLWVLFELFPWVRAEFMEYVQSLQPPKSPAELDLQRQLARLEQLLLQQGNTPIDKPGPTKLLTPNGPRPLQAKQAVAAPSFDDDEDVLVARKNKNAGSQSALNFIKSAFALNGMKFDEPQS
jgi:hypothetical protein